MSAIQGTPEPLPNPVSVNGSPAPTSAMNDRSMLHPLSSHQHSETTTSRFQTERLSNSEPLEMPVNPFEQPPLTNSSTNWSITSQVRQSKAMDLISFP